MDRTKLVDLITEITRAEIVLHVTDGINLPEGDDLARWLNSVSVAIFEAVEPYVADRIQENSEEEEKKTKKLVNKYYSMSAGNVQTVVQEFVTNLGDQISSLTEQVNNYVSSPVILGPSETQINALIAAAIAGIDWCAEISDCVSPLDGRVRAIERRMKVAGLRGCL
jgi:hypothetical protein